MRDREIIRGKKGRLTHEEELRIKACQLAIIQMRGTGREKDVGIVVEHAREIERYLKAEIPLHAEIEAILGEH